VCFVVRLPDVLRQDTHVPDVGALRQQRDASASLPPGADVQPAPKAHATRIPASLPPGVLDCH